MRDLSVQYHCVSTKDPAPRALNKAFYLKLNGTDQRVCKFFLLNTLVISERQLRTVREKTNPNGFVEEECRGKHGNQMKFSEELIQSVFDHINSTPRIEGHYKRADSDQEFIDGNLTLTEMHRHYTAQRKAAGMLAVPYSKYSHVFNYKFNIGFFIPKKDQYDLCTAYEFGDAKVKEELQNEYDGHHKEKCLSRMEKTRDKERIDKEEANLVLAVYDLQAVMPCPSGKCSSFFYKSRLNYYNFTISKS